MKKYTAPFIRIIEVENNDIIATSIPTGDGYDGNSKSRILSDNFDDDF